MKKKPLQFRSILGITLIILVAACVLAYAQDPLALAIANNRKCTNNLKQCAQALNLYCADYDYTMPSSKLVSKSRTWSKSDALVFTTRTGKLPPGGRTLKQTWAQLLYDNMRNPDIISCPQDLVSRSDPKATTSYWYKLANDKAWYGVGCTGPRRSIGDYQYQPQQIAFYEHRPRHYGGTVLTNGTRINASFIDTHVEMIALRNATSGDPINCAVNADGEPMYYNARADSRGKVVSKQSGPAAYTDPTRCVDWFY